MLNHLRALGIMFATATITLGHSVTHPMFGQTGFSEPMPARIAYQGTLTNTGDRYAISTDVKFEFKMPPSPDVFKAFPLPQLPEPIRLPFSLVGAVTYDYTIPINCRQGNKPTSGSFPYTGSAFRMIQALPAMQFVEDIVKLDDPNLPEQSFLFGMHVICTSNGVDIRIPVFPPGFALEGLFFPRRVADRLVDQFAVGSPTTTGTFGLDLACPLQSQADTQPPVTMLPSDAQPWAVLPANNEKNFDELKLLAEKSGATTSPGATTRQTTRGLTIITRSSLLDPKDGIKIGFETPDIPFVDGRFGGGLCFWVKGISFKYETGIQILIAKQYGEGSCQYNAILEHEQKHRKLLEDALRVSQDYLRGRILNEIILPTKNRPAYSTSWNAGVARINGVMNNFIEDALTQFRSQAKGESEALDTDEEYDRVTAKCPSW
jgi:hypothetical protein